MPTAPKHLFILTEYAYDRKKLSDLKPGDSIHVSFGKDRHHGIRFKVRSISDSSIRLER